MGSFGVTAFGFSDGTNMAGMRTMAEAARAKGRVELILVETPANPTNGLVDLDEACAAIADELGKWQGHRPPVLVDNTMLGPIFQVPLAGTWGSRASPASQVGAPPTQASTRARSTYSCGWLRFDAIASSRFLSDVLNNIHTVCATYRDLHTAFRL